MVGNLDFLGGIRTLANKTSGSVLTMYSQAFNVHGGVGASFLLTVHALFASTGGTLDIMIQHSSDMNTWADHTAFAQATDAASELLTIASFLQYVRLKITLDGTDLIAVIECKGSVRADA